MKKLLVLMAAGLVAIPLHTQGAQTAQARIWCFSPRFQGATTVDDIGFLVSLDLTTLPSGVNGELALDFFNSGYTHSTYLEFDSEFFGTGQGAMAVDVPNSDANGNGFQDFFEVSRAVSASSSGTYQSDFGNGSVGASWHRDADSSVGTCTLHLSSSFFGPLDFTHSFELIEYTGLLTYTPGSNAVSGSVNLTQSGNPANTFQGPIQFTKVIPDPFDELQLEPTTWTNAALQTLSLHNNIDTFLRDLLLLTNYSGYVDFDDGDPNTTSADYQSWMLSIDDSNDTDHDGIPDFSDNPQTTLPRRPSLTLARGPTNLLLTISGDINHSYGVQELGSITAINWSNILSLTLTNDPQTVSIPLPSTTTKFWRVVVN